jgi:hypothetical protein
MVSSRVGMGMTVVRPSRATVTTAAGGADVSTTTGAGFGAPDSSTWKISWWTWWWSNPRSASSA